LHKFAIKGKNFITWKNKMSVDERCNEIFKAIDEDGSESIDLAEFSGYFANFQSIVNVDGDVASVFALIDTNNDGSLSKEELKEFISSRLKK